MNEGRDIAAQVIVPDALIGAGKRFEVIKKILSTTIEKILNRLIKVKGFILQNFHWA